MLNFSRKCRNATGAYERIVKSLKRCGGVALGVVLPALDYIKYKQTFLLETINFHFHYFGKWIISTVRKS